MTGMNCPINPKEGGISRRDFLKITAATSASACMLAGCRAKQSGRPVEVAYCGIECNQACPANQYPSKCDGCKSFLGVHSTFWEGCTIRESAQGKDVSTCAECDEYVECSDPMWVNYPMLRANIDRLIREKKV